MRIIKNIFQVIEMKETKDIFDEIENFNFFFLLFPLCIVIIMVHTHAHPLVF